MRFLRSITAIFMPPFAGLGVVVVAYIVWAHLVYPGNDIWHGNLPDPDDYMYLAQVLDWVQGQGWYDNVQHRLDPPAGTPIHFSRLAQIPIALGILFFQKLGLKPHGAAMVTALIEPLVLFTWCLSLLRKASAHFVPLRWAGASAYIALFAVALLFEFMPGHVDHHGLVIALMIASITCVLRMMEEPADIKSPVAAGMILALGLVIALESLPWMLLISAYLGLWSISHGGKAARSGLVYALSLFVGSVLGLLITRSPTTIGEMDILTYSAVYVILAGCVVVPFFGVAAADILQKTIIKHQSQNPPHPKSLHWEMVFRWMIGIGFAVISGALFLRHFPDLATGPYGGIDPQLVKLLLDMVEEARPIFQTDHAWAHVRGLMSMGIIALPAGLYFFWRAKNIEKWKWGLITLLVASALGLTIFYQYRFLGMVSVLAIIPLTALLQRGWQWIGTSLDGRKKVFAEIGLLLLVGPLPAIIMPAFFDSRSFNTGFFLFPVDAYRTPCGMQDLQFALRDKTVTGDKPNLIASYMELGPEFLFRTDHKILAAPFHMNVEGNLDASRMLTTAYPNEAENIARRRGVDLVVLCKSILPQYLGETRAEPSLAERLVTVNDVPDWLQAVPVKGLTNYVIYRVDFSPQKKQSPDALTPQTKKNSPR